MAPDDPEYFYQRGLVYWQYGQPAAAKADFDRALELKPDDLPALAARAEWRLWSKDNAGASADLDAAARAASHEADIRFLLARAYTLTDQLPQSVAQFDLWILSHPSDSRLPEALNGRCWARALEGTDLAKALSDCSAALKLSPKASAHSAKILDSRGLVRLRMGDYQKSIADYDAALQTNPKNPWSLYGRGVDKLRIKKTAEGEADIAAATALWPPVADAFKRRGIEP
jgi:tetratricopeptide (TPR) repeat protein